MRHVTPIALAAALLLPGLIIGCAGDSDAYTPNHDPAGPGAATYRNGPEINNTTDPGADRAIDRGAVESGSENGARDGGLGWGVSGGSPVGR